MTRGYHVSKRCLILGALLILPVFPLYAADDAAIAEGREVAADRKRGNCFSCHMAAGADMAGNGGPPLIHMQLRFPERAALKAQIADPRLRNPETIMPPYGAHGILTERELERLVDYVHTL